MTNNKLKTIRKKSLDREYDLLGKVLEAHDWNITRTAKAIGCPRSSLRCAIKRHPVLERLCRVNSTGVGRPKGAK